MNDFDWLLKDKYQGKRSQNYLLDCERLKAGEPLAYVILNQPFLGCTIYLDSHPLIPRVETEYWVNELINTYAKDHRTPHNILDLCAGSGCIGVALAKTYPQAQVTFSELDKNHHATILKNCMANKITSERINIMGGDLFANLSGQKYDLIISNPPYIDKELNRTELSVVAFEPALALYAEQQGFDLLGKIITKAPDHLSLNGELWLEHEPEQTKAIVEVASSHFLVHTQVDQYGTERFSRLVLQ